MEYRKRAIDLQPGDRCIGPGVFVDHGVVHHTVVIDSGVQISWRGNHPHHQDVIDTTTVRPEDYWFSVAYPEDGAR